MATARAAAGGDATAARHARVESVLRDHRGTLLWIARRWSGSADEAEDALQRAMEIYVRRLDSIDVGDRARVAQGRRPRTRRMALRRARAPRRAARGGRRSAERIPAPDARRAGADRARRSAAPRSLEALAQLKPDERTALLLKAEGYSYREIGERQGLDLHQGEPRDHRGTAALPDASSPASRPGDECERFAPTLLALVQGGAECRRRRRAPPAPAPLRGMPRDRRASCMRRAATGSRCTSRSLAGIAPLRWLGDRVVEPAGEPVAALGRGPDVKGVVHGVAGPVHQPDVGHERPARLERRRPRAGGGGPARTLSQRRRRHVLPRDRRAARSGTARPSHPEPEAGTQGGWEGEGREPLAAIGRAHWSASAATPPPGGGRGE